MSNDPGGFLFSINAHMHFHEKVKEVLFLKQPKYSTNTLNMRVQHVVSTPMFLCKFSKLFFFFRQSLSM